MVYENVIIGHPLISPCNLLARDTKDYFENELNKTLFTHTRFLPKVMVEAGLVKSTSEVRRNRPDLMITLDKPDFIKVKWGKRFLFIIIGEERGSEDNEV